MKMQMNMGKMKAAFFNSGTHWLNQGKTIDAVYGNGRYEKIAALTELYPEIISEQNFETHREALQELDVIFSTWGMIPLQEKELVALPKLKALFYAAGATETFREPFVERGIVVCSATQANAIPVAEFALAQVLLAGAGYFRNSRGCITSDMTDQQNSYRGHGNYGTRVAIFGNGAISSKLQELLKNHHLETVVVPSRSANRTVSIEEAFQSSFAVVNLFPDRDDNAGVFNGSLFRRMMEGAVFINVGRGRQVNETDLIEVMKERPDLTALLDVQHPEPPVEGSELFTVPNIQLSGHLAGAKAAELIRMADYMIEDFQRLEKGEPLLYQVQSAQL